MTTAAGPRSTPPPRTLMRWVVNPVVRSLARSPAAGVTGAVLLLEFTGRRSGRQLSVPVLARPHAGALYALTDASWALNFTGGASVTVTARGRRWAARGELVEDPAETAAVVRTAISTTGAKKVGLRMPPGWVATDDELCALRRAVRISPGGPDPSR
ncbi:hypothetical protein GCM10010531_07350 [Blastococcus jejuensis]|uniref:Deazaflavin-dependent oxidoreductase, nitroreductase family n=1 Tax=Blastococcus jejuensis TaxID=351224 RepID=A0ABP6NV96_9ACTN